MINTFEIAKLIQTTCPKVYAKIMGEGIEGEFFAYPFCKGCIVVVEVCGLTQNSIHALHIHEGKSCTGDKEDPFKNTLGHFSLTPTIHPNHSGDLPPLFSNQGYAWLCTYTSRFNAEDIIGRTIVIHQSYDDFHTQPSGNSQAKIACGKIVELFQ